MSGRFSDAILRQLRSGGRILDAPARVPAVWGSGAEVVWSEGEVLLVVGPTGVGKGTTMQQLALRRAAVLTGDLLGYPVAADTEGLTVYLALDRPAQIVRSLKRMVGDEHRAPLDEQLAVWEGPLPFDLVRQPEALAEFVGDIGAAKGRTVGAAFVDSLKDAASGLSGDEVGGAINRALGALVAAGVETVASHHQRKATSENKKPRRLDDVYGSTWIPAGAGSVILLWGEAGDQVVELSHLKQPAEDVGPFEVHHDHDRGVSTRRDRLDAWTLLQAATTGGIAVADAAERIYGSKPTGAQREKVRRRFDRFVAEQKAVKIDPTGPSKPTLYRPTVRVREGSREGVTLPPRPHTNGAAKPHAAHTEPDNSPPLRSRCAEREGAHGGDGAPAMFDPRGDYS